MTSHTTAFSIQQGYDEYRTIEGSDLEVISPKGKTYTISQAIIYTHADSKRYKAIMKVQLEIK